MHILTYFCIFVDFYAYFMHIPSILNTYFLHICAFFLHILCIFQHIWAYFLHIACIFSAYCLHICFIFYAYACLFMHMYAYKIHIACIFVHICCILLAYIMHISTYWCFWCMFMHIFAYYMHIEYIFLAYLCIFSAYIMHISTYLGIFNAYFLHIFCIYVAHLHIWCHHDHFTMQIWIFLSASMLHPGQAGRCSWVDVTTSAVRSAATVDELLACQVRTYVCIFSLFLHILHI